MFNFLHPFKMLKKIYLLAVCSVLVLLAISFTTALTATTNQTTINLQYNSEKQITFNITNNAAYPLFNINVVNNYTSMTSINLNASQSKIVTVTFKSNKTGVFDTTLIFKGFREKNCVELGATTYSVDINTLGSFTEDELDICTSDIVKITNKKDETLYYKLVSWNGEEPEIVCDLASGNCPTLPLNSAYTATFNAQGGFTFETWYSSLAIDVSNQTILTHSTDDDKSLTLSINCVLESTILTVDYITSDNFTMSYDEVKTGSLIVRNTGGNKAIAVKLSSDWIVFNQNNFDLESGATRSVDFNIYPSITNNNDTGKNYDKTITITSQNSNPTNKIVHIYIAYSDVIAGEGDLAYLKYLHEVYCPAHPFSFLCNQTPQTIIKEVPKYNCPSFLAEMTAEDILELIKKSLSSTDSAERVYNLMKQYADSQNVSLADIYGKMNQSAEANEDTKEDLKDTRTLFLIIVFGTIFAALVVGIGWYGYKYYKKKKKTGY